MKQIIDGKTVTSSFHVYGNHETYVRFEADTLEEAEAWIAKRLPPQEVGRNLTGPFFIRKVYSTASE